MQYCIQAHNLSFTDQNFSKLTGNYSNDVFSSSYKFQLNPITGRVDIDVENRRCFPHSHSLAASCLQVLPCKPMQTACGPRVTVWKTSAMFDVDIDPSRDWI